MSHHAIACQESDMVDPAQRLRDAATRGDVAAIAALIASGTRVSRRNQVACDRAPGGTALRSGTEPCVNPEAIGLRSAAVGLRKHPAVGGHSSRQMVKTRANSTTRAEGCNQGATKREARFSTPDHVLITKNHANFMNTPSTEPDNDCVSVRQNHKARRAGRAPGT